MVFFPNLLTSYGSHISEHFFGVSNECSCVSRILSCIFLVLGRISAVQFREVLKWNIYELRKAVVTRKWSEILRSTDMKPRKFPKVTKELGTVNVISQLIHLLVRLKAIGCHASYRAVISLKGKKALGSAFAKWNNKRRCKILQLARFSLT